MPTLLLIHGGQFTAIRFRSGLARLGAPARVLDALLGTGTLPGATDAELGALSVPVGVIPAVPPDPFHSRGTVDALLRLLPSAVELPGCPEAPRPEFPPHLESFLASVSGFATSPAQLAHQLGGRRASSHQFSSFSGLLKRFKTTKSDAKMAGRAKSDAKMPATGVGRLGRLA